MKKILFLLLGFVAAVSANAQVVEVYKNGTLVHSYNNTPDSKYTVKFKPFANSDTSIDGHEFVEIGGKKWATMNFGATTVAGSPETAYGDYYAWGEMVTYYYNVDFTKDFDKSINWKRTNITGAHVNNDKYSHNFVCYSGDKDNHFKEWTPAPYGNNGVLNDRCDVVQKNWSSSWRMPTKEDFENLVLACCGSTTGKPIAVPENITDGGVYHILKAGTIVDGVTYNVPGILFVDHTDTSKRLFFPAAGNLQYVKRDGQGTLCSYWASSLYSTDKSKAYCAYYSLKDLSTKMQPVGRCLALSIRPVSD